MDWLCWQEYSNPNSCEIKLAMVDPELLLPPEQMTKLRGLKTDIDGGPLKVDDDDTVVAPPSQFRNMSAYQRASYEPSLSTRTSSAPSVHTANFNIHSRFSRTFLLKMQK